MPMIVKLHNDISYHEERGKKLPIELWLTRNYKVPPSTRDFKLKKITVHLKDLKDETWHYYPYCKNGNMAREAQLPGVHAKSPFILPGKCCLLGFLKHSKWNINRFM